MRITLSATILVISMVLGASTGNSAISNVLGAAGECDLAAAGCFPIPTQLSILCNGSAINLNCLQYFSPDFNDPDGLLMYGITNNYTPGSSNSPETIAISWDNNETAYVFMRELSTGDYRIYVTKDAFATVLFLGELIPTNRSPVYSRGDVHIWNGKIYWTSGGMGGDAQLMVIQ